MEGLIFGILRYLLSIRHFHISHNAPYFPPKILHNLCFSLLLGITAFPREIENNPCAKFWGAKKVYNGRCASGVCLKKTKWGMELPEGFACPIPPSMGQFFAGRGRVISGLLANWFGSRFGTNTKLLRVVIGPI